MINTKRAVTKREKDLELHLASRKFPLSRPVILPCYKLVPRLQKTKLCWPRLSLSLQYVKNNQPDLGRPGPGPTSLMHQQSDACPIMKSVLSG